MATLPLSRRRSEGPPKTWITRPYRTTPLRGLCSRQKGGFYDGRFSTLAEVVDHYDQNLDLRLNAGEKKDLVQFLPGL